MASKKEIEERITRVQNELREIEKTIASDPSLAAEYPCKFCNCHGFVQKRTAGFCGRSTCKHSLFDHM